MMHFDLRVVLPEHPVLFFAVPPTVNDVDGHSYKKKQSDSLFLLSNATNQHLPMAI